MKEVYKEIFGIESETVDAAFLQAITKVVGGPILHDFRTKLSRDFCAMMREFEMKKRNISSDYTRGQKMTLKIPVSLIELFERETGESMEDVIEFTPFVSKMSLKHDKMRIDGSIFLALFQFTIDKILELCEKTLRLPECRNARIFIMSGGFAECPFLQSAMKDFEHLSHIQVMVPYDPGLAILKGAVVLGHRPQTFIRLEQVDVQM